MAQYKIKLDIASGIDRTTGQYQIPYLQLKYMPLTIGGRRPKAVYEECKKSVLQMASLVQSSDICIVPIF